MEEKVEEPEVVKIEAPELEGPKVINKIDLSTIDSSTRPRKVTKKVEEKEPEAIVPDNFSGPEEPATFEPEPEEVKPQSEVKLPEPPQAKAPEKEEAPVKEEPVVEAEMAPPPAEEKIELVVAELPPHVEESADAEEQDVPPVIENIKAEKLEGPKILGKIELPVSNDTRPKQPAEEKGSANAFPSRRKTTTAIMQAVEDQASTALINMGPASMVAVSMDMAADTEPAQASKVDTAAAVSIAAAAISVLPVRHAFRSNAIPAADLPVDQARAATDAPIPVMHPAKQKRSTKKRSRKRSGRPRPNWPVPVVAERA